MYCRDDEAAKCRREDGVADPVHQLRRLIFVERKHRAQGGESEGAVAEQKEQQEQHDDELRDDADGVCRGDPQDAIRDIPSLLERYCQHHGAGDALDPRSQAWAIGDEAGYLFMVDPAAEIVDGGDRLSAQLLREEEGRDDDSQRDND